MCRMLNTGRRIEQDAQALRVDIPAETGTKQKQTQEDIGDAGEQETARQQSRRRKLLKRRL